MRSIIELKKELLFNREMHEVIDILKKVAISQYQTLFNRRKTMTGQERYLKLLESSFDKIDLSQANHPILKNPVTNVLAVLITTDMGFLGGLNSNVAGDTLKSIRRRDNVRFFVIGEKGRDYLTDTGKDVAYLPGISDELELNEAKRIAQYIFTASIRDRIGKVTITYPKFFSFAHQEVKTLQLLPPQLSPPDSISPDQETPSPKSESMPSPAGKDFGQITYEPFPAKVVDYLINKWLLYRIYDICWHSKLSEFAARANHLEGSLRELDDMKKTISFQYFRNKHEVTDRTIRDIFGGKLVANRQKLKKLKV